MAVESKSNYLPQIPTDEYIGSYDIVDKLTDKGSLRENELVIKAAKIDFSKSPEYWRVIYIYPGVRAVPPMEGIYLINRTNLKQLESTYGYDKSAERWFDYHSGLVKWERVGDTCPLTRSTYQFQHMKLFVNDVRMNRVHIRVMDSDERRMDDYSLDCLAVKVVKQVPAKPKKKRSQRKSALSPAPAKPAEPIKFDQSLWADSPDTAPTCVSIHEVDPTGQALSIYWRTRIMLAVDDITPHEYKPQELQKWWTLPNKKIHMKHLSYSSDTLIRKLSLLQQNSDDLNALEDKVLTRSKEHYLATSQSLNNQIYDARCKLVEEMTEIAEHLNYIGWMDNDVWVTGSHFTASNKQKAISIIRRQHLEDDKTEFQTSLPARTVEVPASPLLLDAQRAYATSMYSLMRETISDALTNTLKRGPYVDRRAVAMSAMAEFEKWLFGYYDKVTAEPVVQDLD